MTSAQDPYERLARDVIEYWNEDLQSNSVDTRLALTNLGAQAEGETFDELVARVHEKVKSAVVKVKFGR